MDYKHTLLNRLLFVSVWVLGGMTLGLLEAVVGSTYACIPTGVFKGGLLLFRLLALVTSYSFLGLVLGLLAQPIIRMASRASARGVLLRYNIYVVGALGIVLVGQYVYGVVLSPDPVHCPF